MYKFLITLLILMGVGTYYLADSKLAKKPKQSIEQCKELKFEARNHCLAENNQ